MSYTPRPEQAGILERAMAHIRSVPYSVSARWLFYRLLQDGDYQGKDDYHGKFLPLTAKARKAFYEDWRPDTLADDTRQVIPGGHGFSNTGDWLQAVMEQERYTHTKWENQDYYVECWFEAKAMVGQFEFYTDEIPLMAFGGDCSIPAKWETAKRLERYGHAFRNPVVVLYFGDDDPKGQQIPQSALRDIEIWCAVPIQFIRAGLNEGDGEQYGISENPEKPGCYQWEALDDGQSGQIITDALAKYYRADRLARVREREQRVTQRFRDRFAGFIGQWERDDLEDS